MVRHFAADYAPLFFPSLIFYWPFLLLNLLIQGTSFTTAFKIGYTWWYGWWICPHQCPLEVAFYRFMLTCTIPMTHNHEGLWTWVRRLYQRCTKNGQQGWDAPLRLCQEAQTPQPPVASCRWFWRRSLPIDGQFLEFSFKKKNDVAIFFLFFEIYDFFLQYIMLVWSWPFVAAGWSFDWFNNTLNYFFFPFLIKQAALKEIPWFPTPTFGQTFESAKLKVGKGKFPRRASPLMELLCTLAGRCQTLPYVVLRWWCTPFRCTHFASLACHNTNLALACSSACAFLRRALLIQRLRQKFKPD